jgi:peptidyl-prolyl cis-trans isomerase A (cyclophilin A)
MISRMYTAALHALVLPAFLAAQAPAAASSSPVHVLLTTARGDIEVAVDVHHAPVTAANFLRYVEAGRYDGGAFHRTVTREPDNQPQNTVKIEVIQGGADPAREAQAFPPIALERTSVTGLAHLDGTVSMARDQPDTATSDFFICIGNQPELDFGGRRNPDGQGFAAFGQVVRGMEVVRAIQHAPAKGQALEPAVRITAARRLSPDEVAVGAALDDWHAAASAADEERYFGHFAAAGVFLGTDMKERWNVEQFRAYAHPYFAKGAAWSFRAVARHVEVSGDTAWFDESLATTNLGPARGSGVLTRQSSGWKIVLYDLSVPIPNEIFDQVKAQIAQHLAVGRP